MMTLALKQLAGGVQRQGRQESLSRLALGASSLGGRSRQRREGRGLASRMASSGGVEGAAAQPPAPGFTEPDQVKRFADAKARGDPRVLDMDSVYDPSWMAGARVLITGANRGIGLALAREASLRGATVVGACRRASPELSALANVEVFEGVEVTSLEACERLASELKAAGKPPLDVVVNNAGYFPDTHDDFTNGLNFEENLRQYDICAVGPLRVTYALVKAGCVKAPGGKVINITSQGGSALWRQVQVSSPHFSSLPTSHFTSLQAASQQERRRIREKKRGAPACQCSTRQCTPLHIKMNPNPFPAALS